MPSVVLRADAYARLDEATNAAGEWQKVLDSPGIVQLSATAPWARLQLARMYAEDSSARESAAAAYKAFLSLWDDGDSDLAVLAEARKEYSKLQ